MEYNIDKIVSELDFDSNKLNKVGKILLTNHELEILDLYKINYKNCNNLKELLFEIDEVLSNMDIVDDELDYISQTIAERDYYQNTNK